MDYARVWKSLTEPISTEILVKRNLRISVSSVIKFFFFYFFSFHSFFLYFFNDQRVDCRWLVSKSRSGHYFSTEIWIIVIVLMIVSYTIKMIVSIQYYSVIILYFLNSIQILEKGSKKVCWKLDIQLLPEILVDIMLW